MNNNNYCNNNRLIMQPILDGNDTNFHWPELVRKFDEQKDEVDENKYISSDNSYYIWYKSTGEHIQPDNISIDKMFLYGDIEHKEYKPRRIPNISLISIYCILAFILINLAPAIFGSYPRSINNKSTEVIRVFKNPFNI